MAVSTSEQLVPPTFDDFEVIKETFLAVAHEPDSVCRVDENDFRLFIKLERLFIDSDFMVWPPLTICLSGLIRAVPGGNKMAVLYRELPHNPNTVNSSVNHSYVFEAVDSELIDFRHSVRACPELPEIPGQPLYDSHAYQADQGREILQRWSVGQQQPTAGDCGVLFDRMLTLVG